MTKIVPVILAGGTGTRLWPLSRKAYPKQFTEIIGENSLFQESALRLLSSNSIQFNKHIIITNSDFRFMICDQLFKVGIDPNTIILEPEQKNTAPAILAASLYAVKEDPEAILLTAPSDQIIGETKAFHKAIKTGLAEVMQNKFVTFGIKPTRAETGYGYLEVGISYNQDAIKVKKFIEKPTPELAKKMFTQGDYLWNAGIFLFKAKDMINYMYENNQDLSQAVNISISKGKTDLGFFRLDPESWSCCQNISIDYAVMEQVNNLMAVPYLSHWSDLGTWSAVWKEMQPDKDGVSLSNNAHSIECSNTLLRSESQSQQIVGIGLKNIIAIAMPDAVLVADKNKDQSVKEAVLKLQSKNISQAEISSKDHRPWGWFKTLALEKVFHVKILYINPNAALSLQSHEHRSEHWVVVEGIANVTLNESTKNLLTGESIYIPVRAVHRIKNLQEHPLIIVEVQTGHYFGEDDIVRYEDNYLRHKT